MGSLNAPLKTVRKVTQSTGMKREEKMVSYKEGEEQEGSSSNSTEEQLLLLESYQARKKAHINDRKEGSPESTVLKGRKQYQPEGKPQETPPPTSFSEVLMRGKEPSLSPGKEYEEEGHGRLEDKKRNKKMSPEKD